MPQFVRVEEHCQMKLNSHLEFHSPAGPIAFTLYTKSQSATTSSFDHDEYADDTQMYMSLSVSNAIGIFR